MNKKQCSIVLLLTVAINSATAQVTTYKNNAEGVRQARQDVLNAIAHNNIQRAEDIIRQVKFNTQTKQFLTSELQKAKIGAGAMTIADLQSQLANANSNYQALLVTYQGAESQVNGATRSVTDIQQRVDAAKQEHDRLKAENEQHKRAMTNLEVSVREAHAALQQKIKHLDDSQEEVANLQRQLADTKNAQNSNEAARIQNELEKARKQVAEALQERTEATTDVTALQKQLAQNNAALTQATATIEAAHTNVASLTHELQQKEHELALTNAHLAEKHKALEEASARLNARYATETEAALAITKPSDLRDIIVALLQPNNSASIAVALPIVLTNSDVAFHQVAQIASTNKPVQTQLQLLAGDNQNKDNQYIPDTTAYSDESKRAQWIIIQAAKNNQEWAQYALLNAKEEYSDRQNNEVLQGIVRQPKWAQEALLALAPSKDFASDYVINAIENPNNKSTNNLSPNGLIALTINQANKGNAKFQKYITEKAVYASWNYDSKLGSDYGLWALCALKLAAEERHAWAENAISQMIGQTLPIFKDRYAFISSIIGDAISNNKKGLLGYRSNKEIYLDQITKWATNYKTYKCNIDKILSNDSYVKLTISDKIPAVQKKQRVVQPDGSYAPSIEESEDFLATLTDEQWQEFLRRNQADWDALGAAAQKAITGARSMAKAAYDSKAANKIKEGISSGTSAIGKGAAWTGEKLHLGDAANAAQGYLKAAGDTRAANAILTGAKSVKNWTVDTYGNIRDRISGHAPSPSSSNEGPSYHENPSYWESKIGGYSDEEDAPASSSESAPAPSPAPTPDEDETPEPKAGFDY